MVFTVVFFLSFTGRGGFGGWGSGHTKGLLYELFLEMRLFNS